MLASRGQIIPLPLSAIRGSPFETYFAPGLILLLLQARGIAVKTLKKYLPAFQPSPGNTGREIALRCAPALLCYWARRQRRVYARTSNASRRNVSLHRTSSQRS